MTTHSTGWPGGRVGAVRVALVDAEAVAVALVNDKPVDES